MDRTTALRAEKIRASLQTAHVAAQVQARRHVAILAVALTIGAGAFVGGLGDQVRPIPVAAMLASATVTASQIRALAQVSRELDEAQTTAHAAIDKLMLQGGETDADAKAPDEGGTR